MPTTITFDITDLEFSAAEKSLVMDSLNKNPQTLQAALNKIGKAAFMEYIHMLAGKGVPSVAKDVVQERLMLLLDHYYDTLPSEDELTTVFQLTLRQSQTLVKNFKSKYRTRILAKLNASRKAVVDSAVVLQGKNCFFGASPIVIDELNEMIRKKNPKLLPIVKDLDAVGKYSCGNDTLHALNELFP